MLESPQSVAGVGNQVALFSSAANDLPLIGFAMTDDGLILQRGENGTCQTQLAELYTLGAGGATRRSTRSVVGACRGVNVSAPLHTVALGHYAILEPTHELVRIDSATGEMVPIRGLQQGSFETVRAAGTNAIEVHGPMNMQRVDLSQADKPTVTEGGLLSPLDAEALRLEISDRAPPAFVADTFGNAVGPSITLLKSKVGALPTVIGSIATQDSTHRWIASGNHLFQFAAESTTDLRIRRFPTSSIKEGERQSLAADFEQVLTSAPTELKDRGADAHPRVDPRTGDLVVADYGTLGSTTDSAVLTWFSLGPTGYVRSFSISTDSGSTVDVTLFNGRSVVVNRKWVKLFKNTGEMLVQHDAPADHVYGGFYGFNDKFIYVAAFAGGSVTKPAVAVLRADDLSEVTTYPVLETVKSVAEVGNNLAFGMYTALTTAAPACAPE